MLNKLRDLQNYIDKQLGDTDPQFIDAEGEDYEDIIKEDYPLLYIHRKLIEIINES